MERHTLKSTSQPCPRVTSPKFTSSRMAMSKGPCATIQNDEGNATAVIQAVLNRPISPAQTWTLSTRVASSSSHSTSSLSGSSCPVCPRRRHKTSGTILWTIRATPTLAVIKSRLSTVTTLIWPWSRRQISTPRRWRPQLLLPQRHRQLLQRRQPPRQQLQHVQDASTPRVTSVTSRQLPPQPVPGRRVHPAIVRRTRAIVIWNSWTCAAYITFVTCSARVAVGLKRCSWCHC